MRNVTANISKDALVPYHYVKKLPLNPDGSNFFVFMFHDFSENGS